MMGDLNPFSHLLGMILFQPYEAKQSSSTYIFILDDEFEFTIVSSLSSNYRIFMDNFYQIFCDGSIEDSPLQFLEGGSIKIELNTSDEEDHIGEVFSILNEQVIIPVTPLKGKIIEVNLRSGMVLPLKIVSQVRKNRSFILVNRTHLYQMILYKISTGRLPIGVLQYLSTHQKDASLVNHI